MKPKNLFAALGLLVVTGMILGGCAELVEDKSGLQEGMPDISEELDQESILELVKSDLSTLKGVDIEEIGAPSVERVTWDDTSLGCPQESESYAQVLTPGYRILLAIGGPASIEQFDYRADSLGNFVLCEG